MAYKVGSKREVDNDIDLEAAGHIKKPEKAKIATPDDSIRFHRANEKFPKKPMPRPLHHSVGIVRGPPPQEPRDPGNGMFKGKNVQNRITRPSQQSGMPDEPPRDEIPSFGQPPQPPHAPRQNAWVPNFLQVGRPAPFSSVPKRLQPGRPASIFSMPKTLQPGRSAKPSVIHSRTPKRVKPSGEDKDPRIQGYLDKFNNEDIDFQDPWDIEVSDADLKGDGA